MENFIPIYRKKAESQVDTAVELPEITLQQELREQYKYKPSASKWYWPVVAEDITSDDHYNETEWLAGLLLSQKQELPYLASAVFERTCNLRCLHCLYQDEKSSQRMSTEKNLEGVVRNIVSQMPAESQSEQPRPSFMSAGRILRRDHLNLFASLRTLRPDVALGVIDNGSFVKLLPHWPQDFRFDWMDISVDGTREHHNEQRGSDKAFDQAIDGLRRAREVTKSPDDGGAVTSLFTLTNINSSDVAAVADILLGNEHLADGFRVTTMSPTNEINAAIGVDTVGFTQAWEDLKKVSKKYDTGTNRVELDIYRIEDLEVFASVVGEKKFLEAFRAENPSFRADRNSLTTEIDGVLISYLPLSIWPPEEFVIEADSAYRTAYEGQFTLEELQAGIAKDGRDTKPFTVAELAPDSDYRKMYERAVDHWWVHFGKKNFEKEKAVFQRIRERAS